MLAELDMDIIIDRAPDAPEVLLVSPCSGHGFKFAPVIGEIVADSQKTFPFFFRLWNSPRHS